MPPDNRKQDAFEFEPEYLNHAGIQHEFTGTLFVPTESENKRIEKEQAARETSPVVFAEPVLYVPTAQPRAGVKMKMRDALRMRQRGA